MNYLLVYLDGKVRRIWITATEQEAHNIVAHFSAHGYWAKRFWLFPFQANLIKDC